MVMSWNTMVQFLSWSSCASLMVIATPAQANSVSVLFGGDLAWPEDVVMTPFDQKVDPLHPIETNAEKYNRYPFQKIGPDLADADFTFVNLETPISGDFEIEAQTWAPSFRAHPELAKAMKSTGIDLVSTANNHAFDAGVGGLRETLSLLSQHHILSIGAGNHLTAARRPIILESSSIRIGFLAYTEPENSLMGYATTMKAGVAPLEIDLIQSDIAQLRSRVDFVVVSLHWGKTGQQEPTPIMRAIAHQIVDAGADVIVGHHPHVIQGIELYQQKPIIYSLGNLIFSYSRPQWDDNMLVKVTFTKDRIQLLQILPIAGRADVAQPYILKGDRAQTLLLRLQELSAKLNTSVTLQGDQGLISIPPTAPQQSLQLEPEVLEKTP